MSNKSSCFGPPIGGLKTDLNSKLHAKLLKEFPDRKNTNGGSYLYDRLASKEFIDFLGANWIGIEKGSAEEEFFNLEENYDLLDEMMEPKFKEQNGEYYMVNSSGKRFVLNKRKLTQKDKMEVINALSLMNIQTDSNLVSFEIKKALESRLKELRDALYNMEEKRMEMEESGDEKFYDLIDDSLDQEDLISNAISAIDNNILKDKKTLDSVILGVKTKLANFNLRYEDDPDAREQDDIETNSEIGDYGKDSTEVRDTNNIDGQIKAIMASIVHYDTDINNVETPRMSSLLMKDLTRSANEVKNRIIETIANIIEIDLPESGEISDPYDLMMERLEERADENNDSIIREFVYKVNNIHFSKSPMDRIAFETKFVTSFYKSKNNFSFTEISTDKEGKLTLRHIDPASTQDVESRISNEIVNTLITTFSFRGGVMNNEDKFKKALLEKLTKFKTKKDIMDGFQLLGINLQTKTIDSLFKNRNDVMNGETASKMTLEQLMNNLFNEEIAFEDNGEIVKTKSLKKTIQAYYAVKNSQKTKDNIIKALTSRDHNSAISIISKYESKFKTSISDSSLFVGQKQRWSYSLVSSMNKSILAWKSGNLKSLENKKHRGLYFVDFLLALDEVKEGKYLENSPEHLKVRKNRISNLRLVTNSEMKKINDANPTQMKEIGEADLHMDTFFKMFDNLSEIMNDMSNSKVAKKQDRFNRDTKVILPTSNNAEKGSSFGIYGFPAMNNDLVIDKNQELVSLGPAHNARIKSYMKGEFENMKRNSELIASYLSKKTYKSKREYLMENLVPDYHYSTKVSVKEDVEGAIEDVTYEFDAEENTITRTYKKNKEEIVLSVDEKQSLTGLFINAGSWNKFGFFNKVYENNKKEFDLVFKKIGETKILDSKKESFFTGELSRMVEEEIIGISKENVSHFDDIIIEKKIDESTNEDKEVKLFDKKTNIQGSTEVVMRHSYAVNSIFNNMEMFSLFSGELAFYKQKGGKISMEDAMKRGPATLSDGLYIRQKRQADPQEYTTFSGKKVKVDKNKKIISAVLNILENDMSKFSKQIKAASGNNKLNYEHEIADAQGFITIKMFKDVISGIFGWSENEDLIYNRLQDRNYRMTDEDIRWLKMAGRSTQALKLTGFSMKTVNDKNGNFLMEYPVFFKYSVAVLAPSMIAGTDIQKLSDQMDAQGVDQVVFKSGSKASNPQGTTIFKKENGIFAGLKDDMKLNPFEFDKSAIKLQVEMPTKFDKEGVVGNQHTKNLLGNLDLNSEEKLYRYRNENYTAKELQEMYDGTATNILQNQLDKFIEKIGKDANGEFDQTKLRGLIAEQLDPITDYDLIDMIKDPSIPIETVPGVAQRAFPVLSGYIKKNVSKIITNSGSAIQIANIGYDRLTDEQANNIVYLSEDKGLRPPLPATVKDLTQQELDLLTSKDKEDLEAIVYFNEQGNPSLNKEDGNMRIQKARIMLPFASIFKGIEGTGYNVDDVYKMIKEGKIDEAIFKNIIAYRIPNQSISSNDSIEIVGILPPSAGDSAIVYHEITAKTGSDFDIDKLYLMMPSFKTEEDGSIRYELDPETNGGQQNILIELMASILESPKTYDDLISPLDSPIIKDSINEGLYLSEMYSNSSKEEAEELEKEFYSMSEKDKSSMLKKYGEKRKLDPLRQLAPKGMIRARVDMLQAKKLVATMANHMTDIPMSQIVKQILKYDIGIGSNDFSKVFPIGKDNDSEYKITKVVSYLMNAAVDAAKDNYIIEGNFNSYTAGPAMVMIRMGISPENVFKVLLNKDILKLSKLKGLQSQKITDINLEEEYQQENMNMFSKAFVMNKLERGIDFKDFLRKSVKEGEKGMTRQDVIGFWNILQLTSKELNNDIVSSKSDNNGAGKDAYEHMALFNRLKRLSVENIGSMEDGVFKVGKKLFKDGLDVENLEYTDDVRNANLTFLGAMQNNGLLLMNKVARKMFIEATDEYREAVNQISAQLGRPLPIDSSDLKLLSNYLYPYVMSRSGHEIYNINEAQVEYLKKEFSKEVVEKKSLNPDNLLLKEIYIDPSSKLVSFPNFKFFDPNDKIMMREAMEDIYAQKSIDGEEIGQDFINKLVKYAFLTTGFKPTFFNLNEYLPKSYFMNSRHDKAIHKLINNLNEGNLINNDSFIQEALTFMAINNENNYKIVKTIYSLQVTKDGSAISEEASLKKVTIAGTENFYPFLRMKKTQSMLMFVGKDSKGNPIYKAINSSAEKIDEKSKSRSTIRYFDLNNLKKERLIVSQAKDSRTLSYQNPVVYESELSRIFNDPTSLTQQNKLYLQRMEKESKEVKNDLMDTDSSLENYSKARKEVLNDFKNHYSSTIFKEIFDKFEANSEEKINKLSEEELGEVIEAICNAVPF